MPLKLFTQAAPAKTSMTRFGKIRKGGKMFRNKNTGKMQSGRDLDHYRFALEARWSGLQPYIDEIYSTDERLRDLSVVLMGHTPDEVFAHWFEAHGKSGLQHRCDGSEQAVGINPATSKYESGLPCAMGSGADPTDPETFECGCKFKGRLLVAIPWLWELAGTEGIFEVHTSSKYDIVRNVYPRLQTIHKMYGDLFMLPIRLVRVESDINHPSADAKSASGRQNRKSWLMDISVDLAMMRQTHPQIAARVTQVAATHLLGDPRAVAALGDKAQALLAAGAAPAGAPQLAAPQEATTQAPQQQTQPAPAQQQSTQPQVQQQQQPAPQQPAQPTQPAQQQAPQAQQPTTWDYTKLRTWFSFAIPEITEDFIRTALKGVKFGTARHLIIVVVVETWCKGSSGVFNRELALEIVDKLCANDATLRTDVVALFPGS